MSDDYLGLMDFHGLPRSGTIHVGANNASESRFYDAYGPYPVAFFEAVPSIFEIASKTLERYPLQTVYNQVCSDVDGEEVTFNVSSNRGMSSSMFPLGRHGEVVPGVTYTESFTATTARVETFLEGKYRWDAFNLAVIDTQGADLKVLKGLGRFLDYIEGVYIEISDLPLYEGGATYHEIYEYMLEQGFIVAYLKLTDTDWGNAFFKRREPLYLQQAKTAVSVGKPVSISSRLGDYKPEDGNSGDLSVRRKFFHTKNEENPWWMVDLEEPTAIKRILIFDRLEQQERAATLVIDVSLDGETWETLYDRSEAETVAKKGATTIDWIGTTRYVRARLTEKNFLHLRQVSVIADDLA